MKSKSTTESDSIYDNLQNMEVRDLLININKEDAKVADAIKAAIPQIEALVSAISERMKKGGRLFYVGSGTSGRLGIVDASECPPTFGVSPELVVGIISGGDEAIRNSVEHAEDDLRRGWLDVKAHDPTEYDSLIGIAASGRTPYAIGAVKEARENGLLTGCIVCNEHSKLAEVAQYPVEVVVGPEFVTGSTRMKAGTAQKMVLNMISTSLMIQLGRVQGNKMVDMQLTNDKLVDRGIRMIMEATGLSSELAKQALKKYRSVRVAIESVLGK